MGYETDIPAALAQVKKEIASAEQEAGRKRGATTLVAVGKTFDASYIRPALFAGQRVFGENRVQEAAGKWPELRHSFADIELHLIGPLQSNKIRQAVEIFDVIETLDREKLARKLAVELAHNPKDLECFIQVNTGEEDQKAGILPADADEFIRFCLEDMALPVTGLMCIPPVDQEASLHFALLQKIARRNGLNKLSMGMSADYEIAVAFGATHVRVGSAIFGRRDYPVAT